MADSVPTSLDQAVENAKFTRDAIQGFLQETIGVTIVSQFIANFVAGLVLAGGVLSTAIIGGVFRVAPLIATAFLEFLGTARKDNQDQFNEVIAAAMSDLFSVELSADDIPPGGDTAAQTERAAVIGGKFLDLLETEFTGGAGPGGIDGAKAARAMAGFNINFSVGSAFIAILTEIESLGFFKEFRTIGEDMAQNLGLGRLLRTAIKPLIDNLIAKPYDRELRAKYRQDSISEAQLIHGFNAGRLDESTVRQRLAEKGLPDDFISELMAQLAPALKEHELYELIRAGEMDQDTAQGLAKAAGVPDLVAARRLRVIQLQRTDAERRAYLDEVLTLAKERFIDPDTFSNLLDREKLPDEEAQFWRNRLGVYLDSEHRRLTFAQIEKLLLNSQLTTSDLETWATAAGYKPEDEFNLETIVNIDAAKKAAAVKKAAAAAAAAAAKAAKKNPPATT